MLRARRTEALLVATILLAAPGALEAQRVSDPLVERGSLVFRADPVGTTVEGIYGSDGSGETPLGESFRIAALGQGQIPSLATVGTRFGALAGDEEPPALVLGATTARFSREERVVPLQLSYGILDRLTVGVTVPFVRTKVDPLVRLVGDGANVGRNPTATDNTAVSAFVNDADAALSMLQSEVEDACGTLGEGSDDCVAGRALVDDAGAFLSDLSGAYDEEDLFPLEGSGLGAGIDSRWASLSERFGEWDTEAPGSTPPLASRTLDDGEFESMYLTPVWGSTGFPLASGQPLFTLGDVEAHVAVGLLRPERDADSGSVSNDRGFQVAASAVGTMRFATGTADSLQVVAPVQSPRGVSGFELRLITDLMLPGRFAVLGTIEGGWNGSAETTLLAPDAENLFRTGFTRAEARWSPGSHVRASIVPRFRVGRGLSVGAGWHVLRKNGDTYEPIDTGAEEGPSLPETGVAYTQHRAGFELRYAAMAPPLAEEVWFPFELMLRLSRSVSGTAGAPVETRAEAMVRFRLRSW